MDILRQAEYFSKKKHLIFKIYSEGSSEGEAGGGQASSWWRAGPGRSREEVNGKDNPVPVLLIRPNIL